MRTELRINNSDKLNTLNITTSKSRYSGKIETIATVCHTDHERGFKTMSFRMFTDFNRQIISSEGRATKKRLKEQHEKALESIEQIKALVIAHYAAINETIIFESVEQ